MKKIILMTKGGKTKLFKTVAEARLYAIKWKMKNPLIVSKTKSGFNRY